MSAFYLGHRYSEDLDFFTDQEIDLEALNAFLQSLPDTDSVTFERKHDRKIFLLKFKDVSLQVQFDYFPYLFLEGPRLVEKLKVDSLIDITANKVLASIDRNDPKDWVDLYAVFQLSKVITPEQVVSMAEKKFKLKGIREALQGRWLAGPPDSGKLRLTDKLSLDAMALYFKTLAQSFIQSSLDGF